MTVVKRTAWADLDAMERRMRRFFDEAGVFPMPLPAADVYEVGGEYVVELEVPGYEEKDLDIELTDHTLVVKGEIAATKDEKEKTFSVHERLEKSFERRFAIPVAVDLERFHADFAKGVLKITAPKVADALPKTITIGT
jgi:HSP20 family protein